MKLVPPLNYMNPQSMAERRVAALLDQIDSSDQAVAYHSVHLPEHEYKAMAEADFVVLWKGVIVVLEVKGGNIRREQGVWIFRDRFGVDHKKAEGPWQQAQSAMFALRKRVEAKLVSPRYPYASMVVTPDQILGADVEWAPWEYAGNADMTVSRFEKRLDHAAGVARSHHGHDSPQSFKPLRAILRSDFDRMGRLSDEADMIDRQMVSLVEGQAELLEGLEDNPRMIIKGGAGTGKTLLAAEAAARRAAEGKRVLFTCRSEAVVRLVADLVKGADVACVAFEELDGDQQYDVVVVDEAQDLMNVEAIATLDLILEGGIDSGMWWMFLDQNNQAHIDGCFDHDMLTEILRIGVQYTLRLNCRNTQPIITQTQTLLGADLGAPRVGAGPRVISKHVLTPKDAAEEIDAELARLRDGGVSPREIAIVTVGADPRDSVAWQTAAARRGALGQPSETKGLKLWTPKQIKGLEARHVLVVDVDDLGETHALSHLYVAMTRARISLWMAIGNPAWTQIGRLARDNVIGATH